MNVVILLAGGKGERAKCEIPKQFIEVLGKPLILYALEIYEKSDFIDAIEVVVLEEYIDYVWDLARRNNITKLMWITKGGVSCQDSTKNGIYYLEDKINDDDLIMLNMSTSVFVDDGIIEDSIKTAERYGNAFCCMQCIYNNAESYDGISSTKIYRKETCKTLNLPWSAKFGTFKSLYHKAYELGIEVGESSYAPTLFLAMGEKLFFSKDTSLNKLHITTADDLEIVTAILEHRKRRLE